MEGSPPPTPDPFDAVLDTDPFLLCSNDDAEDRAVTTTLQTPPVPTMDGTADLFNDEGVSSIIGNTASLFSAVQNFSSSANSPVYFANDFLTVAAQSQQATTSANSALLSIAWDTSCILDDDAAFFAAFSTGSITSTHVTVSSPVTSTATITSAVPTSSTQSISTTSATAPVTSAVTVPITSSNQMIPSSSGNQSTWLVQQRSSDKRLIIGTGRTWVELYKLCQEYVYDNYSDDGTVYVSDDAIQTILSKLSDKGASILYSTITKII